MYKFLLEKLISNPFIYFIKKFKRPFFIGSCALVITDISDILGPYLMGQLLDKFQVQKNLEGSLPLFALLLGASITTALFRYVWRVYFARFHHSVALDLRLLCFKHYFKKDLIAFDKQSTGDKMSLFSKDIENFRMGIGPGMLILFDAILYLVFIPMAMWKLNPHWTMILVFIVPIIPVVIALMEKKLNKLFDKQQAELSTLSSLAQESLEGIKVIKSFRMEKFRASLYDVENKKLFETSTKLDFLHSSFSPVLEFFVSISCAGLLFSVAYFSDLSNLKIGSLFAFYQYMQRMTWPLTALGLSYMMISEARSSFRRITPVLTQPENKQKNIEKESADFVKLKDVSFTYPKGNTFFEGLNLNLEIGKSYLIAGRTKSGKTSLFNILNGLLDVSYGQRFLSDDKASNPQVPFLFMDSIEKNVSLSGDKLNTEDLEKISFVKEHQGLKDGWQTQIGEKGTSLSGGQKQRLSLLRALKSGAQTLFLDEPMSAVDETTKSDLIKTLKSLKKSGHNLVIATSNPEHYTWLDEVILLEDFKNRDCRSLKLLNMDAAHKDPDFIKLLRVQKENEGGLS